MHREGLVIVHPAVLGVLAGIAILGIGISATPRDARGRASLLLPDVKAVQDYQQEARASLRDLRAADSELAAIVAGEQGDLLDRGRVAQRVLERIVRVLQTVDRRSAPPALVSVHEALSQAALLYLDAARATLSCVTLPDEEHREIAREALQRARQARVVVESDEWMMLQP